MNSDKAPLVSIIVITYNSAKFVLETLESAKTQTYQNVELIISDDGSSDNTVQICGEWLQSNIDRFVCTELLTVEKNTGIPANCNRGVRAAKGEWIKLIAGDDSLIDDCIEKNLDYLIKNPLVKVLVSKVHYYNNTFKAHDRLNKTSYLDTDFFILNASQQYNSMLRGDKIMTTPTLFISKSIYKIVNYDERFKLIEDYPFWLNITKHGIKIHFLDYFTVKYRKSDSSVYHDESDDIIKMAYFRNEELRQIYVYPNLCFFEALREKYNFKVLSLLKYIHCLKKNNWNLFLVNCFTRYLNPFAIIVLFQRKKIIKILYNYVQNQSTKR